jgi:hypothetical protein
MTLLVPSLPEPVGAVVAVNIATVSEGLVLVQKVGVSSQGVVAAIRGGLAGSTVTALRAAGHERDDHSGPVQHYEGLALTQLIPEQS